MNKLKSNLWEGVITHLDTDTRVLEGTVLRNLGSPETKPLHLSFRDCMTCIYTLMIYFGIVSMLVIPSLAQAAFVTATDNVSSLPVVEEFEPSIHQEIFDPFEIGTSASIGESFAGQTVSILPGVAPSQNGWEQVSGTPSGPLSLQTAQKSGVTTWFWSGNTPLYGSYQLQGLLSDVTSDQANVGEGAISILFTNDQLELGLDFLLTNGGDITLQFFARSGAAIETITLADIPNDGSYTFQSVDNDHRFAGVSITHKDDAHGIAIDNLRFAVPEPSLGLLLGISLVGLVGVGAVRNIRKRKVANS